jgi:hypothetical protein
MGRTFEKLCLHLQGRKMLLTNSLEQPVKKFASFHWPWNFVTAYTTTFLSLSWARLIQFVPPAPHPFYLICNLMLCSFLCLGFPRRLFPWGFPANSPSAFQWRHWYQPRFQNVVTCFPMASAQVGCVQTVRYVSLPKWIRIYDSFSFFCCWCQQCSWYGRNRETCRVRMRTTGGTDSEIIK